MRPAAGAVRARYPWRVQRRPRLYREGIVIEEGYPCANILGSARGRAPRARMRARRSPGGAFKQERRAALKQRAVFAAEGSVGSAVRSDGPSMWMMTQWCRSRSMRAPARGFLSKRAYQWAKSRSARAAVEEGDNLAGDLVGGHAERLVDVNVALRYPARGVTEQGRDCEFGETEVAGDAGKGMAQGVRRHIGQTCEHTDPINFQFAA
jgi:hypothetical protein